MDKWATVLRYGLTYLFASLATKYGIDAATQGNLVDATLTVILGLATLAPMIYNLFTRPSTQAMQVAVQTDKILDGDKKEVTVITPPNIPDIKIQAQPTRGNQG